MPLCVLQKPPLSFRLGNEQVKARRYLGVAEFRGNLTDVGEHRSPGGWTRPIGEDPEHWQLGAEQRMKIVGLLGDHGRTLQTAQTFLGVTPVEEDSPEYGFARTPV